MSYDTYTIVWYGAILPPLPRRERVKFHDMDWASTLSGAGVEGIEVELFGVLEGAPGLRMSIDGSSRSQPAACGIEIEPHEMEGHETEEWAALIRRGLEALGWPVYENIRVGWYAASDYY